MRACVNNSVLTGLLACALIIAVATGPALGQAIVVDHVDGLAVPNEGIFTVGATLTFHMRVVGDATNHLMLNNGFLFRSSHLTWGSLTGDFVETYPLEVWFDFVTVMNFWANGSGADTVGIGLLSLFGSGLPAGFDDVLYTFTIGPIDGLGGEELVLDSTWYPPSNPWMWDIVGENVAWGGPYVFTMEGCPDCITYTYCTPQPTILKDIESILEVHIGFIDPAQVDMQSIRVQSKIPPYEGYPIIVGDEIVTACFIMRFLGSSGFRPITGDFEATYTVDYNYLDGTPADQLVGDFSLKVYPGDVTFDGETNIDDLIFAADYFWRRGGVPAMIDNTGQAWEVKELLDIDGSGEINPLDVRAMVELIRL